ncbi:MAG: glycosyltransferase family 2 protein [Spirochaetota bacterium]
MHKLDKQLVSIIVPIYFEETLIDEFYRRLSHVIQAQQDRYKFEVIFVNDGSTDRSLELLLQLHNDTYDIRVIDLSRNFGHQIAITAGIDHAEGDAVLVIDGDLQDPPEIIPQMLEKWQEGFSVVYGKRKKRKGETFFKLITAKIFYRIIRYLSDTDIPADSGDFRLMDRKAIDALKSLRESSRYIRGLVSWVGFKQYALEYERDERFAGETKYSLQKMFRLAFDGITGFSEKPLQLSIQLGLVITGAAFLVLLYTIISSILHPESVRHGWTSLLTSVVFMGGIQLISIGILGLYVGRIHRETKNRPLYIISEKFGFEKK